jgi:hypothetical protein
LVVAPSIPGLMIGVMALATFLFRTPFKIAAGDILRRRRLPRTLLAVQAAVVYGAILSIAGVMAFGTTDHAFWAPLIVAIPLLATQVGFDVRSRSRRLLPELAGSIGIAAIAAAISLAGGESMKVALGLWLVLALRSVASVILVRAQLRRAKQQHYREAAVHAISMGAAAIAVTAAVFEVIPWLGAVAIGLLIPFGRWSMWRPPVRAVIVGTHQTILGALVVALTAIGFHTGF